MKLLILGDSAGTGFGTVTRDLGSALIAHGADVRFVSFDEQPDGERDEPFVGRTLTFGSRQGWLRGIDETEYARLTGLLASGRVITPVDRATFEEVVGVYRRMTQLFSEGEEGWRPKAVIIIGDVASLEISRIADFLPPGFPALHYVPIEGDRLPPIWAEHWRHGLQPVAMTEFGADEIAKIAGKRPPVVYHGVDRSAFWPVSEFRPVMIEARVEISPGMTVNRPIPLTSKRACKEFVAHAAAYLTNGRSQPNPERLWLLRADRLMPRKVYPSLLRALAPVLAAHSDVEFLYHCKPQDEGGRLATDISHFAPDIRARMLPTGWHEPGTNGATRQALNAIYNAADIYVSSGAEGFGLTIAEAMACGVPAVGLDYSAVPEVIGDTGRLVPVGGYFDNIYGHRWAWPDERAYGRAVSDLIRAPGARRSLGRRAAERVERMFRWYTAAEQMLALIPQREAIAA